MPPNQRAANRQKERSQSHPGIPSPRKPHPPSPPQKHTRGTWRKIGKILGSQALAIVAILALIDQHFSTETQDKQYQLQVRQARAAASAAVRQDAEHVTYWFHRFPDSSTPRLEVQNGSGGVITNVTLYMPIPAQKTSQGCSLGVRMRVSTDEGILMFPGCRGMFYYRLQDNPPCQIEITNVFSTVSSPSFASMGLAGSYVYFTDSNGLSWERQDGNGPLVRAKNNSNALDPSGFSWIPPAGFQSAGGCS